MNQGLWWCEFRQTSDCRTSDSVLHLAMMGYNKNRKTYLSPPRPHWCIHKSFCDHFCENPWIAHANQNRVEWRFCEHHKKEKRSNFGMLSTVVLYLFYNVQIYVHLKFKMMRCKFVQWNERRCDANSCDANSCDANSSMVQRKRKRKWFSFSLFKKKTLFIPINNLTMVVLKLIEWK